jgi:hypothetical protein
MAGLTITTDLLQALDESGRYRPRLVSVGVGLSLARRIGQQSARE